MRAITQQAWGQAVAAPAKDIEALVGAAGWSRLPARVRARFASNVSAADFAGTGSFEANGFGRVFAIAGLLFGRPLPLRTGAAAVRIEVRACARGEVWTRAYRFANGAEIVSSVKHAGAGRWLEERAGALIMRLSVFEEGGALVFECLDFLLRLGTLEIFVPLVLTPGRIRVEHHDFGAGRFAFTLEARHPWFGLTFSQRCDVTDEGMRA
jgi:hypothetical protein